MFKGIAGNGEEAKEIISKSRPSGSFSIGFPLESRQRTLSLIESNGSKTIQYLDIECSNVIDKE